jgi:predicted Zn-dependent peptidase
MPADKTTLEERLAKAETAINILQKENSTLKAFVSSAPGQKPPTEKPKLPEKTFKVDEKEYKFVVPSFNYKGQLITAVDALTDNEILIDLVKRKSGVIQQIN